MGYFTCFLDVHDFYPYNSSVGCLFELDSINFGCESDNMSNVSLEYYFLISIYAILQYLLSVNFSINN